MNVVIQHRILNSLGSASMNERFDHVVSAKCRTSDWILDENFEMEMSKKTSFVEVKLRTDTVTLDKRALFIRWLRSGREIFHITGKPGSGKSALMKFLCTDRRAAKLLEPWATSRQLVIAKFFF
jgi:Cdc6-like AAA superfamily ATPase